MLGGHTGHNGGDVEVDCQPVLGTQQGNNSAKKESAQHMCVDGENRWGGQSPPMHQLPRGAPLVTSTGPVSFWHQTAKGKSRTEIRTKAATSRSRHARALLLALAGVVVIASLAGRAARW